MFAVAISIVAMLLIPIGVVVAGALALGTAPRGIGIEIPNGGADLPLDAEVRASVFGWRASLDEARLIEAPLGIDGRLGAEREVPVRVETLRDGAWAGGLDVAVRPAEPLRPDATYRLSLRSSALAPSAAGSFESFTRDVQFATVRAPRPQLPLAPVRLKWDEPLRVAWDAPLAEVRYRVEPPVPLRSWVDPQDPRRSLVALEGSEGGTTYKLTIAEARGANGVTYRQPADVLVAFPPRPALLDAEGMRSLEDGKPLTLRWSTPIDRLKLEIDPPLAHSYQIDRRDPSLVEVKLEGAAQGRSYDVTVLEAHSREGAPLAEPTGVAFAVPEALTVEDLDSGENGVRATVGARPILTFSHSIRDRRAAQAAISLDPPIAGRWEWIDDTSVRFQPQRSLPYDTKIWFNVKPGRDGARAASGSYLEEPASLAIVTESDKVIDVDVTRQIMTLYQQGRAVNTLTVGTGVPGADTPIGEFHVQYKMPTARFRGVNVNGARYDLDNVKWVLAFLGDYTIHGVYWRSTFGAPASNGCVGLTDADAKLVYDWAPEGTRIKIHY